MRGSGLITGALLGYLNAGDEARDTSPLIVLPVGLDTLGAAMLAVAPPPDGVPPECEQAATVAATAHTPKAA
ncbi:MAG: hypothetical protein ABI120_01450 [Gemmatimonadaceae bacterium]